MPLSIAFAFVATHNHFVLDRGGKVFKQTAPVIKLPEGATEDEHLALLGVLNSSTACFWLKQNSHNKGSAVAASADASPRSVEHVTSSLAPRCRTIRCPAMLPLKRGRALDGLAQELAAHAPSAVAADGMPTAAIACGGAMRCQMDPGTDDRRARGTRLGGLPALRPDR